MRPAITIFASLILFSSLLSATSDPYAPLYLYEGRWIFTTTSSSSVKKSESVTTHCGRLGTYFLCEQTINGEQDDLMIFIAREQTGRYYTQSVTKDGYASGRGDLIIEGDRWTYLDKAEQNGTTIYYRNVNVFSGKNRIHFEQAESSDGVK
ncbi:MAG: hypothetical protein WB660_04950 [Candidatus Sulfotelmatobacter sp.]